MAKRKLQFKHLLIIVVFLTFTDSYGQEGYWENADLINMNIDSVDNHIKNQQRNKAKKDSIKTEKENKSKNRYRKNSFRVDLMGKAYGIGISYDRILYSDKFDLHASAGLHPLPLFATYALKYSYSLSCYATFTKYKIKPLFGAGYNKTYLVYGDKEYRHFNHIGAMIGIDFNIGKRWSVQALYIPLYLITVGGRWNSQNGSGDLDIPASRSTDMIWKYGGLNLGYKF